MSIVKSCGFCGAPIDETGKHVFPVHEGYNPDDYPHDICNQCGAAMADEPRRYVTHEMAMDAGDPDLEGWPL